MTLLAIALPPDAADEYAWATSPDGIAVARNGSATAALLPAPARGAETIAVVPAAALSWQRVNLPHGVGARTARLRTVLAGLLEERLLDDPEDLHFALAPAPDADGATWVAVCRRDWLRQHLQALEGAGHPVARIVPELDPDREPAQLWFIGPAEAPQLLAGGRGIAGGARLLPATRAGLVLAQSAQPADAPAGATPQAAPLRYAEPAVAAAAEALLGGLDLTLATAAERTVQASNTRWDLARLDFARNSRARLLRGARAGWQTLCHARRWRALRWGVAALVAIQLVGVNWAAWHARQAVATERAALRTVLLQSFPDTPAVIDAPEQMARAVTALETRTGALRTGDLEALLGALGTVLPTNAVPSAWVYADGTLRLTGLNLPAASLARAQTQLTAQSLVLTSEKDTLVLRAKEQP